MSVAIKHYGVADGFSWADVDSGVNKALEGRSGDWRVDVHAEADTESLAFTVRLDGTKLPRLPEPLSLEKAQQTERLNVANTFSAFVADYVREILALGLAR